jgi:hypothetical protein
MIIRRKTIKVDEVVAVACDRCGREISADDGIEWPERLTISFRAGYGSIFGDDRQVECDLCQHCLKEALGQWLRISNEL